MNICVITPWYPVGCDTKYAFVEQLINAISLQGHNCTVVSPYNTFGSNKDKYPPIYEEKKVTNDILVKVFRPRFCNRNIPFFPISTTRYCEMRAFESVLKDNNIKVDCIYCHFFVSALIGWHYAHNNRIPLYIATGESVIPKKLQVAHWSFTWTKLREDTKGVICVSTKNMNECIKLGYADPDKCKVFPNSIDNKTFRLLKKEDCRQKLGLPVDSFIIAFVGWFIERKGPNRVAKAIEKLEDHDVTALFIGKSPENDGVEFSCDNILFKDSVQHSELPSFLNAADVFVLPTQAEGCCNAIIEAMACGLPIISSNLPFNWDILNENNSIMVDPNNIDEIATAIKKLKDDKDLRNAMSSEAVKTASGLTIDARAKNIIEFIKSKL